MKRNIKIETPINADFAKVCQGFNGDLLVALTPKFPPTRFLKIEGEQVGNRVEAQLWFAGLWLDFFAEIVERIETDDRLYFVDEGKKLPWFLTYWQHKHIVEKTETGATIIDDVTFDTPVWLPGSILQQVIRQQFVARQPLYQAYFQQVKP